MCNLFNFPLTAIGDPLGGCCVTPDGYSVMLKKVGVKGSLIPLKITNLHNLHLDLTSLNFFHQCYFS